MSFSFCVFFSSIGLSLTQMPHYVQKVKFENACKSIGYGQFWHAGLCNKIPLKISMISLTIFTYIFMGLGLFLLRKCEHTLNICWCSCSSQDLKYNDIWGKLPFICSSIQLTTNRYFLFWEDDRWWNLNGQKTQNHWNEAP